MRSRSICTLLGIAVLALSVGVAVAGETKASSQSLLKLKAGSCKFTLLDSNGVKPVAGSTLSLASVKDGKGIAKTASDRMGQCVLNIPKGRHILKINEHNLAIIETTVASKIKECRIIVSKDAMVVGGDEKLAGAGKGTALLTTKQVVVGGLSVLTVGGGGYAAYDNNKSKNKPTPTSP